MNNEEVEFTRLLLSSTREELVRADNKASILLAASGLVVGALLAALLSGDWSPFSLNNCVEWLWWVGAVFAGVGIGALGNGVYPRTRANGPRNPNIVAYYGDVSGLSRGELMRGISYSVANAHIQPIDQLGQVSRIVVRKYNCIKTALWAFSAAVSVICSSLFLNLILM